MEGGAEEDTGNHADARRKLAEAAYRLRFFTARELAANAGVTEKAATTFIGSAPYFEPCGATGGGTARDAERRVPKWEYRVRPERIRDLLAASGGRAAGDRNPGSGEPPMTIAPLLDLIENTLTALEGGRIEAEHSAGEMRIAQLQFRAALLHLQRQAPQDAAAARRAAAIQRRLDAMASAMADRATGGTAGGMAVRDAAAFAWPDDIAARLPLSALADWSWRGPDEAPPPSLGPFVAENSVERILERLFEGTGLGGAGLKGAGLDDPSLPGRRAAWLRPFLPGPRRKELVAGIMPLLSRAIEAGDTAAIAPTALCAAALNAEDAAEPILSVLVRPRLSAEIGPEHRDLCLTALARLAAPWIRNRRAAGDACFYLLHRPMSDSMISDPMRPLVHAAAFSANCTDKGMLLRQFAAHFAEGRMAGVEAMRNLAIQLHLMRYVPLAEEIGTLVNDRNGLRFLGVMNAPDIRALTFSDADDEDHPFTVRTAVPNPQDWLIDADKRIPLSVGDDEAVAEILRTLCSRPPGAFRGGLKRKTAGAAAGGSRFTAMSAP